jgi:hypothetical protein
MHDMPGMLHRRRIRLERAPLSLLQPGWMAQWGTPAMEARETTVQRVPKNPVP